MDHDPVFVPVTLLPHHEDQPIKKHTDHESHTERHRNTKDYVAQHHSPITNRKNAGILLRRLSDDFNARKFPDLVEAAKKRRVYSEGDIQPNLPRAPKRNKTYTFIRQLSGTAIAPVNPTPRLKKYPSLTETESEEDEPSL